MKISSIGVFVVVASACLIALGAAGWRGTTDSSTLHGNGRGGQGFGRGCNSRRATLENATITPTSTAHQGRGNGRGWGQTRLASFSQAGQGCGKSSGGCQDGGACSKSHPSSKGCGSTQGCSTSKGGCNDSGKSDCGGCSEATGTCETKTGCKQDSEEADPLVAIGIGQPHLPRWMDADPASDSCNREEGKCGTKKAACGDKCDASSEAKSDLGESSE